MFEERVDPRLVEAGLHVDDVSRGVDPRAVDRVLRQEPLVEDAREHLRERRPQARSPRRAGREHEPVTVDGDRGGHHALHPLPGLERPDEQVGFAEHAVQVHVVARQEVPRAQPEAGGEHAGVARAVDHAEVRRVLVRPPAEGRGGKDPREGERPLARVHAAERGKNLEGVDEVREPASRLDAHARVVRLHRREPLHTVGSQVAGGDEAVAFLHQA